MKSRTDSLRQLVEESGFRESVVSRGEKRVGDVRRAGFRRWLVEGRFDLGDEFEGYEVVLVRDPRTRSGFRYVCSCMEHAGGGVRRRRMCSRILAVIQAMLVSWRAGVDIDVEHLLSIVLPVIAYIFGESWTDARAVESGRHEVQGQ